MCKVINLFGEPGCGKSSLAAYIFYRLKVIGYNCELCDEFAKELVYEKNSMALSNQSYVFGQQLQKMNRLKDNVDIIITDSPLFLCGLYIDDSKISNMFFNLVYDIFNSFNNYNYVLKRNHKYVKDGRLQDEKGAAKIREELIASLKHYKVNYTELISSKNDRRDYKYRITNKDIDIDESFFVNAGDIVNDAGEYIVREIIRDIELDKKENSNPFNTDNKLSFFDKLRSIFK